MKATPWRRKGKEEELTGSLIVALGQMSLLKNTPWVGAGEESIGQAEVRSARRSLQRRGWPCHSRGSYICPQLTRKLLMDVLGKHQHSAANHSNSQRGVVKRANLKCGKPSCWSGTGVGTKSPVPQAERQHHHLVQGCRASRFCFGGRTCSHLLSLFLSTPCASGWRTQGESVVRPQDGPGC